MEIKILGSGCHNCLALEKAVADVLADLGARGVHVERIDDVQGIRRYMSEDEVPGLVINGILVSTAVVPDRQTLTLWLRSALQHERSRTLDDRLRESDFAFWSAGKHKIMPAAFFDLYREGKAVLLDVRAEEEQRFLSLPFALHIPIHELPDRLDEVPRDKTVALFCSGGDRAAVAYAYLRGKGFDNVRIFKGGYAELAAEILPGKLRQRFGA